MNIEELTCTTGEWLRGTGRLSDVVISSRVRLARNLVGHAFLASASATERTEIFRLITDRICETSVGKDALLIDIEAADELDRQLLVERHLISRQHAAAEGSRGVCVAPFETSAVMINEEDHLRIQALRSGLSLDTLWDEISGIDDTLGAVLQFAFDERLGYLTACPTNVGTGIRVSVMLHLPALQATQEIERVMRGARDLRLAVRGLYGEGTDAIGDLYQISNQTTLGKSEEEIIRSFGEGIIPKIVEYERTAREALSRERSAQLDDKIWRAFGMLSHARTIGSDETIALLSPIRMGIHMDRFGRFDVGTLNELFLHTQPAHLQKLHGEALNGEQRSAVRGDYLRKRLSN
ncbi:MAG: protein arginine kinase [Phycisphaerae bacterium]